MIAAIPWAAVLFWGLAPLATTLAAMERGQLPVDYLAYQWAAEALARGESPYATPEQDLETWRAFHRAEAELLAAHARGEGESSVRALLAGPQLAGPYVYPPTLALLVWQLEITAPLFICFIVLSVLGFGALWIRSSGASAWWLGLIVGSWDVLASATGGNVELVLLGITLLAARLLWTRHAALVAPPTALVLLVKPFYALFFVAFGLVLLASSGRSLRDSIRTLARTGGLVLALVILEAVRWGGPLRLAAADYLGHATDHLWLVLDPAEQTPMSAWNRTPLQAIVSVGTPLPVAQLAAIGLWILALAMTLHLMRGKRLSFPLAFALAFVLLYLGRPVGWGLIYLDLVVAVVAWPVLPRWGRTLLLAAIVALAASRWWALVLTLDGRGLPLLTVQDANRPWETWLVLPLAWLVSLYSARPAAAIGSGALTASVPAAPRAS